MKLKTIETIVKPFIAQGKKPDLVIHTDNHEYDLGIYDYLFYKNKEVIAWTYIPGDASENENDKIIIYI